MGLVLSRGERPDALSRPGVDPRPVRHTTAHGRADGVPAPGVSNETVVATYDRLAGVYDSLVAPFEAGTRRRVLDLLDVEPGDRALEVGCGPGHAAVALGERVGGGGRVLALDAAPGMVSRARRRCVRAGVADRVDVLLGDARRLPLRDGSVDVALIEDTLELFAGSGIASVVDELARVLDSRGQLGVVTMEREGAEDDPFTRGYDLVYEHVPGYDRVGCRPVYARRALESAGFEIERWGRHRRGGVWPVAVGVARVRSD